MKRKVMIQIIERVLHTRNTGHYSYNSEEHADMILTAIEDAGMLPPGYMKPIKVENDGKQYPLIPGDYKNDQGVWCTPGQTEWEEE